jgi:hypothetical protein
LCNKGCDQANHEHAQGQTSATARHQATQQGQGRVNNHVEHVVATLVNMCRSYHDIASEFFLFTFVSKGVSMKIAMALFASAFMLVSMPSFAGSHGGGKMDDKKVDCSKKENEANPACVKK